MNPAISFAMWRFGVFPGAGVIPYIIAQLLGSVLGALVARFCLGPSRGGTTGGLRCAPAWARLVSNAELFIR